LAVLPFLYPGLQEIWPKNVNILQEIFNPIASLYALNPAQSLWFKPFAEWTRADWKHPDHESVLWDIRTGAVTTYPGIRERPIT
jgi:hypothetical protein